MAPPRALLLAAFLGIACFSASVCAKPHPLRHPLAARYQTVKFNEGFNNLWGPQHESVSPDHSEITIWLDRSSGSGFKSLRSYRSGYFGAAIKLPAGYTAGVNTAFYLSNNQAYPDHRDEIDMEFLGTIPGRPYTLQTNVFVNSRDSQTVSGREQQIHLWFDPTADFHHYGILWTPSQITFFVDDTPIRRYPRVDPATFPSREMWVYGSIWDASSWATDDGRYKADYKFQPFVAKFRDFVLSDF